MFGKSSREIPPQKPLNDKEWSHMRAHARDAEFEDLAPAGGTPGQEEHHAYTEADPLREERKNGLRAAIESMRQWRAAKLVGNLAARSAELALKTAKEYGKGAAFLKNAAVNYRETGSTIASGAEKAKAYAAYFADKEKSNSEKLGKFYKDLQNLGNWYRALPLEKKLAVSMTFATGAGVAWVAGGAAAAASLTSILTPAIVSRKILAGLASYTAVEALIEKRIANKEQSSGAERSRAASVAKHASAAIVGFLVGDGATGWALEKLGHYSTEGVASLWHSLWPQHDISAPPAAISTVMTPTTPLNETGVSNQEQDVSALKYHASGTAPLDVAARDVTAQAPGFDSPTGQLASTPPAISESRVAFSSPVQSMSGAVEHATLSEPPQLGANGYPTQPYGAVIDKEDGSGSDELFARAKAAFRGLYKDPSKAPANVREFLTTRTHVLSSKFGLLEKHPIMHVGDKVEINEQGQIVFTPKGGVPEVLAAHTPAESASLPPQHAIPSPTSEQLITKDLNLHHHTPGTLDAKPTMGEPVLGATDAVAKPPVSPMGGAQNLEDFISGNAEPRAGVSAAAANAMPAGDAAPAPLRGAQTLREFVDTHESNPAPVAKKGIESLRSALEAHIASGGITPGTVAEAIQDAPHMPVDSSLASLIEPHAGEIQHPIIFMGHDGGLTVYGTGPSGTNTYEEQWRAAARFAANANHPVNVVNPEGSAPGYRIVNPDGTYKDVFMGTPGAGAMPDAPAQSVYAFRKAA